MALGASDCLDTGGKKGGVRNVEKMKTHGIDFSALLLCSGCPTEQNRMSGFTHVLSGVLEAGNPRARCQQAWCHLGLSAWLMDSCLLCVSSQCLPSVHEFLAFLPLLLKTPVLLNQESTLRIPLNLKEHMLKGQHNSKYSHVGS